MIALQSGCVRWNGAVWLVAAVFLGIATNTRARSAQNGRGTQLETLYQEAARAYAAGRYSQAAAEFRQALTLDPSSPKLLNDLGVAYYMAGQFREAVATLKKAVAAEPASVSANLILGLGLVRLNRFSEALAPLNQVLALEPANKDALAGVASADFALGRMDDALRLYLRLVALHPHDANAWYGLGICFEQISERDTRWMAQRAPKSSYYHGLVGEFLLREGSAFDAAREFRKAIAPGSQGARARIETQLGYALLKQEELLPAQQEFRRTLASHETNADAMLGLAAVAVAQAHAGAAGKWLCAAFTLDPQSFPSHVPDFVGALSPQAGEYAAKRLADGIASPCREAVRLVLGELARPGSVDDAPRAFAPLSEVVRGKTGATLNARSSRGAPCANAPMASSLYSTARFLLVTQCAYDSGWFFASFEAAQWALRDQAENIEARYWRAEAAKRLAREAFLRLVSADPSAWQSRVLMGDIYRERKQWQEATANYEAAARLMPSSPAPFLGLATVAWQNGMLAKAAVNLQQVLQLDSRNAQANFEMGDILVRQHKFGDAVPYLQRALAADPEILPGHGDLGKCYAQLGQTTEAVRELTLALPTDRTGDLHYLLYLQYKKAGDAARAKQALAKSQQLRIEQARTQQSRLSDALHAAQARSTQ